MTANYRQQLENAISATSFVSLDQFAWFGQRSRRTPASRGVSYETLRRIGLNRLQSQLYSNFYCTGVPVPGNSAISMALPTSGGLLERLLAANRGGGDWDGGWLITSGSEPMWTVSKEGLALEVHSDRLRVSKASTAQLGEEAFVWRSKHLTGASPGYYIALGDTDVSAADAASVVRLYLSLDSEGAVKFLRHASGVLNKEAMAFRLKVASAPAQYARADSVVLYIGREDYDRARELLEAEAAQLASHFRDSVPAFTKLLAPGLALAEDPGTGESFGEHRCGIFAEGVMRAFERGQRSLQARLEVVEECFTEVGIDLDQPYLNPGSSDVYEFEAPPLATQRRKGKHDASSFTEVATRIGDALCAQATWFDDRCNWMATQPADAAYGALGPDLYAGSAGVGWFLAELAAVTGAKSHRRTAVGALRRSLAHAAQVGPGLFTGRTGIALAAARSGRVLNEPTLISEAVALVRELEPKEITRCGFDVLDGCSGVILGLLALRGMLDEPALLDEASGLGEQLLARARQGRFGLSWRSPGNPREQELTGFSHGAAGAGAALLELFAATRNSTYREAALQAFKYEDHWINTSEANWPDFREVARRRSFPFALPYVEYWCHGAPGIALSRLRGYELLRSQACRSTATLGLKATTSSLQGDGVHGEACLCHGWSGRAEILSQGFQVLGEEEHGIVSRATAAEAAQSASLQTILTTISLDPSLMTGTAGVGFFYLRMDNPELPSPLILRPTDFRRT